MTSRIHKQKMQSALSDFDMGAAGVDERWLSMHAAYYVTVAQA